MTADSLELSAVSPAVISSDGGKKMHKHSTPLDPTEKSAAGPNDTPAGSGAAARGTRAKTTDAIVAEKQTPHSSRVTKTKAEPNPPVSTTTICVTRQICTRSNQ